MGELFMYRTYGIKRWHGCQRASLVRFLFCLQDVGKGREQDAEAFRKKK